MVLMAKTWHHQYFLWQIISSTKFSFFKNWGINSRSLWNQEIFKPQSFHAHLNYLSSISPSSIQSLDRWPASGPPSPSHLNVHILPLTLSTAIFTSYENLHCVCINCIVFNLFLCSVATLSGGCVGRYDL